MHKTLFCGYLCKYSDYFGHIAHFAGYFFIRCSIAQIAGWFYSCFFILRVFINTRKKSINKPFKKDRAIYGCSQSPVYIGKIEMSKPAK